MTKPYLVAGIGHAIVDSIASGDEAFLREFGLTKGTMRLTSSEEAAALYAKMGPAIEASGGSAANTCAGIASFGGAVAFMGKLGRDRFADVFTHDIRAAGVTFDPPPPSDTPTGTCLIIVTPDGERTMNTNLGAAAEFASADLNREVIEGSRVVYLEGYLFDPPFARDAFHTASSIAKQAGTEVAFTLSDPFCVERHRDAFRAFLRDSVDIAFANEKELLMLYPGASFDEACREIAAATSVAVVTRSEKGARVLSAGAHHDVPAFPVEAVVDATGAGDLFAAGFLYGYTTGRGPATAARLGAFAASEVIQHIGPRPQHRLQPRATAVGLL
jgi:sugar/nucleoside kinase (ribokinase family)